MTDLNRRDLFEGAQDSALTGGDFDVAQEQLGRLKSVINQDRARNVFSVFRRTIRPGMLWGAFCRRPYSGVAQLLQGFYRRQATEAGASTPPQHGKSIAAEDFSSWVAGKHPARGLCFGPGIIHTDRRPSFALRGGGPRRRRSSRRGAAM